MGRKSIVQKGRLGESGNRFKDKNGYWRVRVTNPETDLVEWPYEHRLIWEKEYGPIPEGSSVRFSDRDKDNLDVNNLKLVEETRVSKTEKLQQEMDGLRYENNQLKEEIKELQGQLNNLLDSMEGK